MPQAKIFFRSLLFSTSKRGQVIENLFLRVRENQRSCEFSFWGYGDKDLVRGSGLFVPDTGLATNHHFNPAHTAELFLFSEGVYSLELMAKVVGTKQLVSLWTIQIQIPEGVFGSSISRDTTIFYSWSPDEERYLASIEKRSGYVHALTDPHAE